jgi:hypothetical protein
VCHGSPYYRDGNQSTANAHFLCMRQKFCIMYDATGWTDKSRPNASTYSETLDVAAHP